MKRREFLRNSAALGVMTALGPGAVVQLAGRTVESGEHSPPLQPSDTGVPVAFVIADGAVVIDFFGPMSVFRNVYVPGRTTPPFTVYAVAESMKPVKTADGIQVLPDYTFDNAPSPKVTVIPALGGTTDAMLEWIRKGAKGADLTMSVCTGAFVLAKTGLLAGKRATTHHASYVQLAMDYPGIQVKRGMRFVDEGNVASSGGLTAGIDLALHVVERYYGRHVAVETAYQMEYQGQGWLKADSNSVYKLARKSTPEHPLCPVCFMDTVPGRSASLVYKGKTYYFCFPGHKDQFAVAPDKWLEN